MSPYAIPQLALILMLFGAAIVVAAQAVHGRFGDGGLLAFWLGTSAVFAWLAGAWLGSVMPGTSPTGGHFLIPFLFLAVLIGAVAAFIAISTRKGIRGRRQVVLGMIVFTVAVVPAIIVAQLPGVVQSSGR